MAASARMASPTAPARPAPLAPARRQVVSTRERAWRAAWATSASRSRRCEIVQADPERNLLVVSGSVPGREWRPGDDPQESASRWQSPRGSAAQQARRCRRRRCHPQMSMTWTARSSREESLDDYVFGAPVNTAVLHQVVTAQLSNRRQGTASTKTRAEVSGGNKKPYRQKGTGRARQGSTRAPHCTWRWHGLWPASASLRARDPAQGEAPGDPLGAFR